MNTSPAEKLPNRLSMIRAAIENNAFKSIIRLTSGRVGMDDLWNAAMNALYGGTGIHPSRCNADGTPKPETLAEFPRIQWLMDEARDSLPYLLSRYERFGYR